MIKFKSLREKVNEALRNPYKGKSERDLKRKLDSFESQLQDLIKKSRGRQRREIEGEIRDMETKIQQVKAALKEDVNEAKYNDNDLVHIAKANVRGNNNPKTDKIIGYSKAPKNPNKFPNPKSGANAIMRIGDAKKKGFRIESIDEALSGLRGKDGKTYKVDVMKSGRKIEFKITNQFGDFKTINLKQAAKLFEEQDLEKLQADD